MSHITVHHAGILTHIDAPEGAMLAPLLREAGLLTQPCGVGKCGKCRMYADTVPCAEEQRLLGKIAIDGGVRLACYTTVQDGLSVTIPGEGMVRVLTSFTAGTYTIDPLVGLRSLHFSLPSLEDQRDDLGRCLDACGCHNHALPLAELARLPAFVRGTFEKFALIHGETLVGFSTQKTHAGLIVDIGTTTLAVLLADLSTGNVLTAKGERNAQAPWGADVISRIRRCEDGEGAALREAVVGQIDRLCAELLRENSLQDVHCVVLTGNSTMLHVACGLPPGHMGRAPFIPAMLDGLRLSAREFGLQSQASLFVMSGISAYVGADITAALLAAEAHRPQAPFLLLDLGTNAEIVLGVEGRFLACSAAAGPCFEGATLFCGMAGEPGAIETVRGSVDAPVFTTIGGLPPKGLCGSGVLDTLALLLDGGGVDETGRIECLPDTPRIVPNSNDSGRPYYALTDTVRLTQQDIREIQLAKAAVRAGIDILLRDAGLDVSSIARLYLAGGFGAALNPQSAARIGLIPEELVERVVCLGNAAGYGALRYATEQDAPEHAKAIIKRTRYLELSGHPDFSEAYVERMVFPE